MANGLLDFFGKDYEDPRTQGLLQFGLGLMQQGGYQDRPVSLGQAFGAAGQQGMQAYQQAVAQKQRKEQLAAQKSMQDLQAKQIKAQLAKDEAAQASAQRLSEARKQFSDFNALAAGDPQFIPKGMDVQAEQMRLFQLAYPEKYAEIVAKQFEPSKPAKNSYAQYGDKVFMSDPQGNIDFSSPVYTVDPKVKEDKYVSFGNLVFKQSGGEINFDKPEFTIPDDVTAKKGFVTFVNPKTNDIQTVREDDEEADRLASEGYRIIESSQATGSVDELVGMTKPVVTTLAKDIIAGKDFVAQAEELRDSYDPQYLTRLGKFKNMAFSEIEKLDPSLLNKDQREYLAGYTNFATQAYGMVNDYIKSITGAAMSVEEAKRILKAIPNIDEMSPTQFVTSLNKVIHQAQLAKARNIYMLENGIVPTATESNVYDDDLNINVPQDHFFSISIRSGDGKSSEMDRILNREQEKLAKELVSSRGFSKSRAEDMATRQIMDKYGYSPNAYLSL